MNIVIYGATRMAIFLASNLAKAGHNITMCDPNPSILERVARTIDIGTRTIPERSWQILEELYEDTPEMLMALTKDDELNICISTIAKHLGYAYTIAMLERNVTSPQSSFDISRVFSVDHFIAPHMLAAFDIFEKIVNPGTLSIETFVRGNIQMRTVCVPDTWPHAKVPIGSLQMPAHVRCALIFRPNKQSGEIIFPHRQSHIFPGDEVTVIGDGHIVLEEVPIFFGTEVKRTQSVMVIGASEIGIQLARLLTRCGIWVKLVENDEKKSRALARDLEGIDVIAGNGCDFHFLVGEKIDQVDIVVVATGSDEFNMMAGALAKRAGAAHVIAIFEDQSLRPIVDELDLVNEVSPWLSALKRILSIIDKHTDISQTSIYEGKASMVEFKISANSRIAGMSLSELSPSLPEDFLIAAIESRGYLEIAHGGSVLCPHDTVIAMVSEKNKKLVETLI